MGTKTKHLDYIIVHNNMAKVRNQPMLPVDMKMSVSELADRMELLNKIPIGFKPPEKQSKIKITKIKTPTMPNLKSLFKQTKERLYEYRRTIEAAQRAGYESWKNNPEKLEGLKRYFN